MLIVMKSVSWNWNVIVFCMSCGMWRVYHIALNEYTLFNASNLNPRVSMDNTKHCPQKKDYTEKKNKK